MGPVKGTSSRRPRARRAATGTGLVDLSTISFATCDLQSRRIGAINGEQRAIFVFGAFPRAVHLLNGPRRTGNCFRQCLCRRCVMCLRQRENCSSPGRSVPLLVFSIDGRISARRSRWNSRILLTAIVWHLCATLLEDVVSAFGTLEQDSRNTCAKRASSAR